MNEWFKAVGFASVSVSMMMCNIEQGEDGDQLDDNVPATESEHALAAALLPLPCVPMSVQLISGINDNFAAGAAEVPTPSAAMADWIDLTYPGNTTPRNYDAVGANQYFAHTFTFAPPTSLHILTSGTLLGRLKCGGGNDAFHLGIFDTMGFVASQHWGAYLAATPFVAGCSTTSPPVAFSLNLGSLPTTALSVIPGMSANGRLDVMMQDDSAMDYLALRLSYECNTRKLP